MQQNDDATRNLLANSHEVLFQKQRNGGKRAAVQHGPKQGNWQGPKRFNHLERGSPKHKQHKAKKKVL